MRVISGMILLLALLGAGMAGCGSGNRLDLPEGGGGHLLPVVNQVDSGEITLTLGDFDAATDVTLSDPASGTAVKVFGGSHAVSGEQIYDVDGDGLLDYIIITIRALSAQGAACPTAFAAGGDPGNPLAHGAALPDIIKIGGATFLPYDAIFQNHNISITLPVNPAFATQTLAVYKFVNRYLIEFGRLPSDDIGTNTGFWVPTGATLTNNGDNTFTFEATQFGEYCLAYEHDQGGGASI